MSNESESIQALKTGVQISSEIVIPGGSNLVKGDLLQGGIHAGLGIVARILFGVPGVILVSTNSLSKALTGRHLYEHLSGPEVKEVQALTVTPTHETRGEASGKASPIEAPPDRDEVKTSGRRRTTKKAKTEPTPKKRTTSRNR